jgi:DNA polymerase sigma
MMEDLQEAINSKWPKSTIMQFGSFPVGLSIFMSDMDISIVGFESKAATDRPSSAGASLQEASSASSDVLTTTALAVAKTPGTLPSSSNSGGSLRFS